MSEIIKSMFMPSHLVALFFALAILARALKLHKKWARLLFGVSMSVYIVFSIGVVAAFLIGPLEYRYPYLADLDAYPGVDNLVLLTAYASNDEDIPLSSRGNSASVYRVLETVRVFRARPELKIIISGNESSAEIMKSLLESLGVPSKSIIFGPDAAHTADSAVTLMSLIGDKEFFLVTSAGHMPRSVGSFRRKGLRPIPAPTDYQLPRNATDASIAISPFHLYVSDLAIREYGGLVWYWLTGRLAQG